MTIERVEGGLAGFDMSCDICGEEIYLDFDWDDFLSAIQEAKSKGWKSVKTRSDWEHYCPDCVKKVDSR